MVTQPWSWFWAPQLHFPFSGGVAQTIEPNINWFFDAIRPGAGTPDIERQAFDIASYGKQLGWITEVLLSSQGDEAVSPAKAKGALKDLKDVYQKIEGMKAANAASLVDAATSALDKLRDTDRTAFDRVMRRYSP